MEEDVLQFLRSRAVPQDDIIRMQRDKVDKAVLSIMTDEQMARYISSYGDRVAVLSFCQQAKCSTDKHTLLQKLRDKIGTRKMKSKAKGAMCGTSCVFKKQGEGMARHRNNAGESTSRKIEIGWLHFSNNDYQQVRTRKGGGTRHATVEKTTNIAQILQMRRELFFSNGLSTKGRVEDFTFHICDFKRHQLPMDDTVGHLYEQTKLKLLRFYICTREQAPSTDEESPEVDQCTVDSLSKDSSVNISEGADLQLTSQGAHSDVDDSTTDQLEHGHAFDSDTSEQVCDTDK
uniref:uncharacterized protein LOC109951875 n=1 Tax=Monopterus albus TaxID=43700 RepID=UPI0009B324D5|nr:uncharacterized protein LOC109951875 [Monopterus albus]XP_020460171.1 uncharacterized protein LOC109962628 [Monopterus albus]